MATKPLEKPLVANPEIDAIIAANPAPNAPIQPTPISAPSTPPVIPADNLGEVKPLKLAPTVPATAVQGTQDFISTVTESSKKRRAEEQTKIDELRKEKLKQKSELGGLYDELGLAGEKREEIYQEEGVDKAKQEVDDLTSQIEAEQLSNRRRVEELEKNPQGLFGGALQQEINRVNRESIAKQADLAIIQNAATRRYSTASAIADRKLEAELEPLKVKLDALKFFYEENKDDLTTKEKQQFDELIKEEDRVYEETKTAKKTLQDTKLALLQSAAEQGAPLAVQQAIQNSSTPEGAITAAGIYGGEIKTPKSETVPSSYSPAELRSLKQARFENADDNTKNAFVSTPTEFQDLWIRSMAISQSNYPGQEFTGEQMLEAYTNWYNSKFKKSSTDRSVDDL